MHAEPSRGFGNIAIVALEDMVNVRPAHVVSGTRMFWRFRMFSIRRRQRLFEIVRIGGLGKVINRPGFDGGDGAWNIAVSAEDDDPGILTRFMQGVDHVEAAAVIKTEVDDSVIRRILRCDSNRLADAGGERRFKSSPFHGPSQTGAQGVVIINNQKRSMLHNSRPFRC